MIRSILDNDTYKLSMQSAVCKLYPWAKVDYKFFNRGGTKFPEEIVPMLREEVAHMEGLSLSGPEKDFLRDKCDFLSPVYLDFLSGYRYDPKEVTIDMVDGDLRIGIGGYWYRTILWEVPLMALVSELYFMITEEREPDFVGPSVEKARQLEALQVKFADFGTRRRYSGRAHRIAVAHLKENAPDSFVGTSNLDLARTYDIRPIGTQAHEWIMFHGAVFGYQAANIMAMKRWVDVYGGDLGIALSDTYTTEAFIQAFDMKYAKLFDGVRQDSGDPVAFADKIINYYETLGIDPATKTIVFSDALDVSKVEKIHDFCDGRIRDSYGIGTKLTNDFGPRPLNIVIKMTGIHTPNGHVEAVKLSDDPGKHTGDPGEVETCKSALRIA